MILRRHCPEHATSSEFFSIVIERPDRLAFTDALDRSAIYARAGWKTFVDDDDVGLREVRLRGVAADLDLRRRRARRVLESLGPLLALLDRVAEPEQFRCAAGREVALGHLDRSRGRADDSLARAGRGDDAPLLPARQEQHGLFLVVAEFQHQLRHRRSGARNFCGRKSPVYGLRRSSFRVVRWIRDIGRGGIFAKRPRQSRSRGRTGRLNRDEIVIETGTGGK